MITTPVPVEQVPPIARQEVRALATTENRRVLELLRGLDDDAWSRPTDCTGWTVRDLSGHVLGGMELFATVREFGHQMRIANREKGEGPMVDAMTALQVRERAALTRGELLDRLEAVGPRVARSRARVPRPLRWMTMKEEVDGVPETWRLGYLLDVILTRDTWMHRVDLARATGSELELTADHDGRVVADVVAEWARRHGRPFTLRLDGPAGGTWTGAGGGEEIHLDAVEFCRVLSGRGSGTGLLSWSVPF